MARNSPFHRQDPLLQTLESKEFSQLDTAQFKLRLAEVTSDAAERDAELERLRTLAETLVTSSKTGDVRRVKDAMERLERAWKRLHDTLGDKRKEAGTREEQTSRFVGIFADFA